MHPCRFMAWTVWATMTKNYPNPNEMLDRFKILNSDRWSRACVNIFHCKNLSDKPVTTDKTSSITTFLFVWMCQPYLCQCWQIAHHARHQQSHLTLQKHIAKSRKILVKAEEDQVRTNAGCSMSVWLNNLKQKCWIVRHFFLFFCYWGKKCWIVLQKSEKVCHPSVNNSIFI